MTVDPNDLRIYIVFRADLPEMTRAKGEVQAGHAAASAIYQMSLVNPDIAHRYMTFDPAEGNTVRSGQAKIAMEVDDLAALDKIIERARNRSVNHVVIQDAAHTVFSEPTITCVAIGPCRKADGNNITRNARMRE